MTIVGRNGPLSAYATDDPEVVRVVNEKDGRTVTTRLALLLKFGWQPTDFDQPSRDNLQRRL